MNAARGKHAWPGESLVCSVDECSVLICTLACGERAPISEVMRRANQYGMRHNRTYGLRRIDAPET